MRELYDRLFDVLRKLDREKPTHGVKIIFAFFVHDANHLMLCGFRILENFVNFPQFERSFVFFVSDADCEVLLLSHVHSRRLIFIRRLPIPCASNQWISA